MPDTFRVNYRINPPERLGDPPIITEVQEDPNPNIQTVYEPSDLVTDLGTDMWGSVASLRASMAESHQYLVEHQIAEELNREADEFAELPREPWRIEQPAGEMIQAPPSPRVMVAEQDAVVRTSGRTFRATARIRDVDLGGEPIPDNVDRRCIVRPDRKTGVESWKTE